MSQGPLTPTGQLKYIEKKTFTYGGRYENTFVNLKSLLNNINAKKEAVFLHKFTKVLVEITV